MVSVQLSLVRTAPEAYELVTVQDTGTKPSGVQVDSISTLFSNLV